MNYYSDLYHSGVLGMKWGKRKVLPQSTLKKNFDKAKQEKKTANKVYSKAFDKTTANPLNSVTKSGDKKYRNLYDLAEKANRADKKYAIAKAERKEAIKTATNEINKQTSFGEKMLYNQATRKAAAKYVVDNNMSMDQARKKANAKAMRNTAIFMAAYGTTLVVMSKLQ